MLRVIQQRYDQSHYCIDTDVIAFLIGLSSTLQPFQNTDLAAVIMQEGLAHICLIMASMTLVRAKIEQAIPRKRKGNVQQHEKVFSQFVKQAATTIKQMSQKIFNLDVFFSLRAWPNTLKVFCRVY